MKWYADRLRVLDDIEPVISICGDDCAVCPRFLARTEEELHETAPFDGGSAPFLLKTLHRSVFRALEPQKTVHWIVFRALDPTKPAENRLEMQANPLETASPSI